MPDSIATSPKIIAEAGLLWLREHGGSASVDRAGRLWAGADVCPIAFGAFEGLEILGHVRIGLPAPLPGAQLVVELTDAGRAAAVSDEATRRYRRLMHGRFED